MCYSGVPTYQVRQQVRKWMKLKLSKGGFDMTIEFASTDTALNIDASREAARRAVEATKDAKSILSKLGEARSAVETIMGIVEQLAEIHPIAKATFAAINIAFKHVEQQDVYDNIIRDLASGMMTMLSFAKIVHDLAKIEQLKQTVVDMLKLTEDASYFIVHYLSHNRVGRFREPFISSSSRDRVDGFIKQFKVLKEEFDRGVAVQIFETVDAAQEKSILAELRSVVEGCGPSYDDQYVCMDGTRQKLLQDIERWAVDITNSPPLLWIHGLAGIGKSSIACSIAQRLHNLEGGSRLGATFFCKRDDPYLRDPNLVIPRIASRLASAHKPFGNAVAAALQAEPHLATDAISLQFEGLIKIPLRKASGPISGAPLVIMIDALDECGISNTSRRQLLSLLHEMAGLVPWLKVIVTSRPDPDIQRFFNLLGTGFRHLDLDHEEPYEDILTFVTNRMAEIARDNPSLPPTWPGPDTIRTFAHRAGRLFIWVRVASDFIANATDVQYNLDVVLADKSKGTGHSPYEDLDTLFKTALEHNIRDDEHDTMIFRDIVGTIIAVATRDPLPVKALETLLEGEGISPQALDKTIRSLRSVMYEDRRHSNTVRLCHPSFMDFLTNPLRCPPQFFVDLKQQNVSVACMCLRAMNNEKTGLKFNICGLESSHRFNADIIDLKDSVDRAISKALRYSCKYWHSHLGDTSKGDHIRISEFLKSFFSGPRPLYWLEVLSLLGALQSAISGLLRVVEWLADSEHEDSRFAADMHRFVSAFYEPMSLSAPHIYISALPFTPRHSIVSKRLHHLFPDTVHVVTGLEKEWSPCLHISDAQGSIESLALSSDGRRIVSGSWDHTIRLWDGETGAAVSSFLEGHTEFVNSVAFSPDSRWIVSGSWDRTIRIWDAETGVAVSSPFKGSTIDVASVAFSPDSRQIVSGSFDGTVRIWDAETGASVSKPFEGHTDTVRSVAFSADGERIVSGSYDSTVRIWDPRTGTVISGPLVGHISAVSSVAFSPDGRQIVSGSFDNTVRIWDAETGAAIFKPFKGHTNTVRSVAFSPVSQWIVSGSSDKTVRLWDAATGMAISSPFEGHTSDVSSVAFFPDGRRIVSGSYDNTIRIWDAEMDSVAPNLFEGHTGSIRSVAFSPDNQQIVSGSSDNTVRIWDAETGVAVSTPFNSHTNNVNSVAFSPDGLWIVSGSSDRTVRVWNAQTGTEVSGPFEGHTGEVTSVAFSPDGRQIVSGSFDGTVRIWDSRTGVTISNLLESGDIVRSVAFSQDGRRIASGSSDNTVRVWDVETGVTVSTPLEVHTDTIRSVAFSPDSRWIVSGSSDNTIRIWDTETGASVLSEGHISAVSSVAFSPNGQWIVSGSFDSTIRIWDAKTGRMASGPFEGHSSAICSVAFSIDGRWVISGSFDKTIRFWDAEIDATDHTEQVDKVALLHNNTIRTRHTRKTPSCHITRKLAEPVDTDGWIRRSTNALLLWVPVQYRSGLMDQCVMSMPVNASIAIDCDALCHGTSWTDVQSQL